MRSVHRFFVANESFILFLGRGLTDLYSKFCHNEITVFLYSSKVFLYLTCFILCAITVVLTVV